jgi:hypothetical protein
LRKLGKFKILRKSDNLEQRQQMTQTNCRQVFDKDSTTFLSSKSPLVFGCTTNTMVQCAVVLITN